MGSVGVLDILFGNVYEEDECISLDSVMVKVLPLPGRLVTITSPPWAPAMV